MTAGFHTLCADTEIMSPIGLGYEMKAWEGMSANSAVQEAELRSGMKVATVS